MSEGKESGGGLAGLFGLGKKKDEEPKDPRAPIEVTRPEATRNKHKSYEHNHNFDTFQHTTIKFKGVYDLDGLYRFMSNWLRRRRYELHEKLYKSRPPELRIEWTAERKITRFVMETISITYHSWGEYDVDMTVNGKKKKMTNARLVLVLTGAIDAPYEDIYGKPRWNNNRLDRWLLYFLRSWGLRRELEASYWDTLYYEMYKLHGGIKDFLKLEAKGNVY